MKKTRILYIEANRDGTIGGSYYSLFYLLEGLDKTKYEPIVMFYQDNPLVNKFKKISNSVLIFDHASPYTGHIRSFKQTIKVIPRFLRDIVYAQFKLKRVIDRIKPDIVHLNNSYASCHDWVIACKINKIKIIAHDRGARAPASFQTKLFIRLIDATISVSDAYLNNIISQNLKPKIAYRVYNGLDVNKFDGLYSQKSKLKIRNEFNVGESDILIGMVGNVDYWKGQIVLVKAIKIVLLKYKNIKCVIVGKTAENAEGYEKAINSYILNNKLEKNVILAGYRDDVPALLNAFDIFIHASVDPEPFGRVILEAMAMKKPIIATRSGGTVEQIIDGVSGLLVPMNDEHAMAESILIYIKNMEKAKLFGANASNRLKENFSITKMIEGVENVYEHVLSWQ